MRLRFQLRQDIAVTLIVSALVLSGCGSAPQPTSIADASGKPAQTSASSARGLPVLPPAGSGRGGYYQDDGPGDAPPEALLDTPDAEPKVEPYTQRGNRPYVVFGKSYTPFTDGRPFKQRGIGSWYGKKFHGQMTSSGEIYDMYKMTAAHPTLPLPSYVRVRNVGNGRQVIVRVNDRGPFHSGRIIDLSYTAALKLGYLAAGSAELEVERLLPDEIARINSERQARSSGDQATLPVASVQTAAVVQPVVYRESLQATSAVQSDTALPDNSPAEQISNRSLSETLPIKPPAAAPTAGAFYLQFGAFGNATNAENLRNRLSNDWGSSLPPLEIIQSGGMYRIHGGPFGSRSEAETVARQIQGGGTGNPVVVRR